MKYDLRFLTKYSFDVVLEPKEIVKVAMKKEFRGLAIEDRNTIKGEVKEKRY